MTFITIDAIDTTFREFISFIFVVGKDISYVVEIDAMMILYFLRILIILLLIPLM